LVPLLDALDHHANAANVHWQFLRNNHRFERFLHLAGAPKPKVPGIVFGLCGEAARQTETGAQLLDSYGSSRRLPDPILVAKYGFVNPDRSRRRAALLAPHHRILDADLQQNPEAEGDRVGLQQYLAFQDGCERCLDEDDEQNNQRRGRLGPSASQILSRGQIPGPCCQI